MIEVLTVQHYSEDIKEVQRITLAAASINLVSASVEDTIINGISVRPVTVFFQDGGTIDITISHSDLNLLERAVGSFLIG